MILLAQLGARVEEDERIGRACAYLLEHGLAPGGQWTASGAPSGKPIACRATCAGRFGFLVFYVTDILQIVEALAALGYAHDPRLANALDLIRSKQDAQGRWPLEYDYAGKSWIDVGPKKQPNKWVTLRALRALKAAA